MTPETLFSIFLGVGLAASVGFRVFVPLFLVSLSSYYDIINLNESWIWLSSSTAIITLGVATIVEILAYYIPWLDNILDSITIPLAAIAGTIVMVSTTLNLSPVITWALAIIAGGGTATAIKTTNSSTRLTSTATTGGVANPIVSTIETGSSIAMSLFSIFIPIVAIFLVMLIFFLIKKVFTFFRK